MDDLQKIRGRIDEINDEMLKLFSERMELSKIIGNMKKAEGKPIYDRKREEEILQHVSESCSQELCSYSISFFRSLMEISREYQQED